MKKLSKNKKLNGVLNDIKESLLKMGLDEVKRYYNEFQGASDYNIVQYGNLLIYYTEVKELYAKNNYKSIAKMSDNKVWEIYKRQVGYITRLLLESEEV